jgi:hypothetical protein
LTRGWWDGIQVEKNKVFFLSLWHNRGVQAAQGQEIRLNREEVVVGERNDRTVGFSCFKGEE